MLTICLLGPTQLLRDDEQSLQDGNKRAQAPLLIKRRKSRALLYYVAAQPQPVARRQLIGLLWPDHTEQTARHNLRTTLYNLRQEIGDFLWVADELVGLDATTAVDVRTFSAILTQPNPTDAELQAALALYRGDFLADFDSADTPDYDNWVAAEREHYRRLAIRGLQQVSRRHEATGDYQAALDAVTHALSLDPFQEDLQRTGLRLHYYAGDRAGAIRRYEEFVRLLDAEMGVPPMAETHNLYDAIITDALPPPAPVAAVPLAVPTALETAFAISASTGAPHVSATSPPSPPANLPFTGRVAELQQLHEWRDSHQLILVEGDAGMGKTRLVETYIEEWRHNLWRGEHQIAGAVALPAVALIGRARELESRLPYQPMVEALRTLTLVPYWPQLRARLQLPTVWWWEVARLLPELAGSEPPAGARTPDESRLWEGVLQFLVALSQQTRVLLFLDDIHWADAATLGLVGYLVRQAATSQLSITFIATSRIVTARNEPAILVQALLREELLARIMLHQLAPGDVLSLAQQLSADYSYPLSDWLYRSSEGNPLILAELLRCARYQEILQPDGKVNLALLPSSPVVPPTIYALIQSRLADLSEAARRVLDAAVAVGREFEFEVVARAAALSDSAALDALDELQRARLVYELDAARFAFDHSLTLEVAYQEVGELRHRLLHRRVAAALEAIHHDRLDEMAGLIAQHYGEGNLPEQASKYARRAAQRATKLAAWQAAAGFWRQALEGAAAADRPQLLVALGNAYIHAGELALGRETMFAVLTLTPPVNDPEIMLAAVQGLAEALILQGRYDDVIKLAQEYAEHPAPAIRIAAQFMWGAALSLSGQQLGEATQHLAAAEAILRATPALNRSALHAQVEFELGNIAAQQGDLIAATVHYERTLDYTRTLDSDEVMRWHILAHNNLAYHLHLLNDARAMSYIENALALAREKGMITQMPYLLSTLGELALAADDYATAETAFCQGLAQAQRLAHPERIVGLTANLGLVAVARGQTDLAIHRFTSALAQAEAVPVRFLSAQIHLWLAPLLPPEQARTHLAAARAIITTGQYHRLLPMLESYEAQTGSQTTV